MQPFTECPSWASHRCWASEEFTWARNRYRLASVATSTCVKRRSTFLNFQPQLFTKANLAFPGKPHQDCRAVVSMATMEVNSRSDTFISLDCGGNLPSSVLSFVCVSLICLISISRNPQVKTHRSWTEIENCAGFIKTLGSTLALQLVGMCVEKWIPVSSTAIFHNVLQLRNSLFAAPCAVSFFIILKAVFNPCRFCPQHRILAAKITDVLGENPFLSYHTKACTWPLLCLR